MNTRSVSERLGDTPSVRDTILSAAAAARHAPGANPHAMSHAWLYTGPPGSGRSVAAQCFAAALVCDSPDVLGCGECEGCRKVFRGAHTDVVHVVPKELSIQVETVRDLIRQAYSLPTIAEWRIVIFEDADRLTMEAANTLLKTVEEPPEYTVIIMCAPSTDPEDFPQTLRSRCRHLYIPSPSTEEIVRILTIEEGASEPDARLAAAASLHHVGRARKLVNTPAVQQRRAAAIKVAEHIFHGDQAFQAVGKLVKAAEKEAKEAYADEDAAEIEKLENALGMGSRGKGVAKAQRESGSAVKQLEKQQKLRNTRRKRDVLDLSLIDLSGIYRDGLLTKAGVGIEPTNPDFAPLAQQLAANGTVEALVASQEAIRLCREHLDQNVQPQIAFDGMVGRIRQAFNVR